VKNLGHVTLVLAAASLGVSACDPIPQLELRNSTRAPLMVHDTPVARSFSDPDRPATVASEGRVRILWGRKVTMAAGGCELTYLLPAHEVSNAVGAVTRVQLGPDLNIYLRSARNYGGRYRRFGLESQPDGWPVAPSSKVCP
jgi:hypothetical protein